MPAHPADELAVAPVAAAAAWEVVRRRRRSPRAPPVLLRPSIANAFGVLSGEAHDDDNEESELSVAETAVLHPPLLGSAVAEKAVAAGSAASESLGAAAGRPAEAAGGAGACVAVPDDDADAIDAATAHAQGIRHAVPVVHL